VHLLKRLILLSFLTLSLGLVGCGSSKNNTENFSKETVADLKVKAKHYTMVDFKKDKVPLNEYVVCSGTITKIEDNKQSLAKGDRFILKNGSSKFQIFNEQDQTFEIGSKVTVYGEYYGFIKGTVIEKSEGV
jgi:hypothetical protein